MDEKKRLQELSDYQVIGSSPEPELDELTQIASAICDTPISLISLIDDKHQWFKSKKGLDVSGLPRNDGFCQHALHNADEVLVVNDPLNDERFKENPYVMGQPHIRFYAGAPLQTAKGNILGTLCILDNKPRTISENQKIALKLLAKKVMRFLDNRKLLKEQNKKIRSSALHLKKLADQVPGIIYQLEIDSVGKINVHFVSKGIQEMFPRVSEELLMKNPKRFFSLIHPEDVAAMRATIHQSFEKLMEIEIEFRVVKDKKVVWHWAKAKPERKNSEAVVWYGTLQDITHRKEYEQTLEEILSDISHVIRRPVTTMMALSSIIEEDNLDEDRIREYARNFKTISQEMDSYTRNLNDIYFLKIQDARSKIENKVNPEEGRVSDDGLRQDP